MTITMWPNVDLLPNTNFKVHLKEQFDILGTMLSY